MRNNKLVVIVMGNIATGKTTFIDKLKIRENRTILKNDDYTEIYNGDLSNDIFESLFKNRTVVLEGNYMSRRIRSQVIKPINSFVQNVKFICFDFGPGNNSTLMRRLKNSGINEEKTKKVHSAFLTQYNEPVLNEGFLKIIKCYNKN